MSKVYKIGDVFVNAKLGVITIIEALADHQFKCEIYNRQDIKYYINHYLDTHLDLLIVSGKYKYYPVKE